MKDAQLIEQVSAEQTQQPTIPLTSTVDSTPAEPQAASDESAASLSVSDAEGPTASEVGAAGLEENRHVDDAFEPAAAEQTHEGEPKGAGVDAGAADAAAPPLDVVETQAAPEQQPESDGADPEAVATTDGVTPDAKETQAEIPVQSELAPPIVAIAPAAPEPVSISPPDDASITMQRGSFYAYFRSDSDSEADQPRGQTEVKKAKTLADIAQQCDAREPGSRIPGWRGWQRLAPTATQSATAGLAIPTVADSSSAALHSDTLRNHARPVSVASAPHRPRPVTKTFTLHQTPPRPSASASASGSPVWNPCFTKLAASGPNAFQLTKADVASKSKSQSAAPVSRV